MLVDYDDITNEQETVTVNSRHFCQTNETASIYKLFFSFKMFLKRFAEFRKLLSLTFVSLGCAKI